MAANTAPIYPLVPNIGFATITTADNVYDGTGAATLLFTAGANGSAVFRLIVKPNGVAAASVLRLFINNGLTNATAANNTLILEQNLSVAAISATLALATYDIQLGPLNDPGGGIKLNPNYRIYGVLGTTSSFAVTLFGGDY